jgi:hypothetical protein
VESPILQEFSFSLVTDCHLLVQDLVDQKNVPLPEVISLGSQAEALYISVVLTSRGLGAIRQCHDLWNETAQLFDGLCRILAEAGSKDLSVAWLGNRLEHFRSLAEERREIYDVTEEDRSEYAERRSGLPDEEPQRQPEPVAEFSKLETASIERAYRRL